MKSKLFATTVITVAALSGFSAFAQGNGLNSLEGEAANVVTFNTLPGNLTRQQAVRSMGKVHALDGSEKLTQH